MMVRFFVWRYLIIAVDWTADLYDFWLVKKHTIFAGVLFWVDSLSFRGKTKRVYLRWVSQCGSLGANELLASSWSYSILFFIIKWGIIFTDVRSYVELNSF
jgi:hypothetical protein